MEAEELENAIDELEVRLERLRALYEQYFLGFEKIEPAVARKDVDRRIYVLRREKIRNTARRFRLQNIIQRYNTFQQYWQRICREIENGTYKRHVLRAEKTIGPSQLMTAAARRRFGKERERESNVPPPSEEALVAAALETGQGPRRTGRPSAPPRSAPKSQRPEVDVGPRLPPTRTPIPPASKEPPPRAPGMPPPPPRRPPPMPAVPAAPNQAGAKSPPVAGTAPAPPRRPAPPAPSTVRAAESAKPTGASAGPPPARPTAVPAPGTGPAPAPSAPAKPALTSAPAAKPTPAPAAAADPRARALHDRLVAASREAKRPVVSLESLEKTIRSTEASLRAKHPNRRIEFDIVLKDGKPVLKPIVR